MSLLFTPGVPNIPIRAGKNAFANLASASGAGTEVDFTAFRIADGDANLVTLVGAVGKLRALVVTNLATTGYITLQLGGAETSGGDPMGFPLVGGASVTLHPYDLSESMFLVDGTATSADVVLWAIWE